MTPIKIYDVGMKDGDQLNTIINGYKIIFITYKVANHIAHKQMYSLYCYNSADNCRSIYGTSDFVQGIIASTYTDLVNAGCKFNIIRWRHQ